MARDRCAAATTIATGGFDRRDDDRAAARLARRPLPAAGTLIDGVVDASGVRRSSACRETFPTVCCRPSQQDQTARPGDRVRVRVMDNKGAKKWSCTPATFAPGLR